MTRSVVPYEERRPPQRISNKEAIEKAESHVRKWGNLKKHLKKIEELAMGVYMVTPTRKGGPSDLILRDTETGKEELLGRDLTIYKVGPNLLANQYLVDRALGKTPQRYEITGDDGGPVEVVPWLPAIEAPVDYIEGEVIGTENGQRSEEILYPTPGGTAGRA